MARQLRRLVGGLVLAASVAYGAGFLGLSGVAGSQTLEAQSGEAAFLSRVRRLTVDGRRAGEGYWSADGSRLVFQSEREPGNPFYQIYLMNLQTGDTSRVSPGLGKTT